MAVVPAAPPDAAAAVAMVLMLTPFG
jgi:hypothetical protein